MASEYDTVPLGKFTSVRSGFAFKSSNWTENGIPVVKIANVKDGRLVMDGCSFVSQPVADSAAEFALQAGDILIAMTGYIGDVAIVRERDLPAVLNQRVGRFAVRDLRRLDQRFLFYLLRDTDVRKEIEGLGYGSAQPNVSPSLILGIEVPLPSLPEQRAIAHILGTLDDKIELNRRMNETLEAMARALFKSWFVDFDPVRAKAEGRDPGLPKSLADLFPARLVDSELGEIPEGWEVGPILRQARLLSGGTPKTNRPEYWDGPVAWASAKDVSQANGLFLVETERTITELGLTKSATQLIPAFSSVVVARGATTGRMVLFGQDMAMNQTCYALATTTETPFALHCRLREEILALVRAAHGSVFDTITTKTFEASRVVLPPPVALKAFEERAAPLFLRLLTSSAQCHTLAALRNALLPKLFSGELPVSRVMGQLA